MTMISVIIPNYNHARYLKQRIDPVINQTYQNLEIIILDDDSKDNSNEIIEIYRSHPLVKSIIYNSKNSGSPFIQWQRGIDASSGDWIWIAESDDYAHVDFLKEMMVLSNKFPEAGFLYCDSVIVRDSDCSEKFSTIKNKKLTTERWNEVHSNKGLDELNNFMIVHGTVNNTSAALFKANYLKSFSVCEPLFKFIGDKFVFCRMLLLTDIAYSPLALNYYRSGGEKPKHTNNYFLYAFEHFLILSWITKSTSQLQQRKIDEAIQINIKINFLSDFLSRINKYLFMLGSSPKLFYRLLVINLRNSINGQK
jgi:glycosyltransferase involved in cell wall biosynthesis